MAEADILQQQLWHAQNSDGGWGYQDDSPSWTEPTAFALLALAAQHAVSPAYFLGLDWLVHSQRSDGGWAPQPRVEQSTWVTSLATLALSGYHSGLVPQRRGISWLLTQTLPEDLPLARFMSRLLGVAPDSRPAGGSPWFPGTAAWVSPTATSLLALSNYSATQNEPQIRSYVHQAQNFILSRRCHDGGWNHGGARYRSDNANSYPEMTGLALLALQGADVAQLAFPLQLAATSVLSSPSIEALSWLQLGLLAHGHDYREIQTTLPCRTVRDTALRLLALAGNSPGNKLFTA